MCLVNLKKAKSLQFCTPQNSKDQIVTVGHAASKYVLYTLNGTVPYLPWCSPVWSVRYLYTCFDLDSYEGIFIVSSMAPTSGVKLA